eukprot:4595694-Amphidinium_carterae.1
MQYVRGAEEGNGQQTWQALLQAKSVRNASALLTQLFDPKLSSTDPRENIRLWNRNCREYDHRTGESISDGLRKS